MTMRRFTIKAFLVFAAIISAGISSTMAKDWTGIYAFEEEVANPGDSKGSNWFRLEVKEVDDGKLVATYSDGIDKRTTRRFQLKVVGWETRAEFYFDQCLPLVPGKNQRCTAAGFKSGDLMFELEEVPRHCEFALYTVWKKINLAKQFESEEKELRSDFFRKVLGG